MDIDVPPAAPTLPSKFIKIISHPHSMTTEPTIIPLEGGSVVESTPDKAPTFIQDVGEKPWAPFRTRADFEYTETAIKGLLSKNIVDAQLQGINNHWAKRSKITLQTYMDMERTLAIARADGLPVIIKITVNILVLF
jgi:hypothetical protein